MMVWLPWFWLHLVPLYLVTGQDKHFMGGSISFTSSSRNLFKLTVVTGWKLGEGPCGPHCDLSNINKNTNGTKRQMEAHHHSSYFGKWDVTVDSSKFNELLKGMSSYTSALNQASLWEQEIMVTDVLLAIPVHDEIRLSGLYWIPFQYNYVENVNSFLQVDLKPWSRNDTGLPNNSPVVMFKPLYRITPNNATKIVLATMDKDDDFVRCEVSPSNLTTVKTLPNTTISKDCSVTVEAYESDGFVDGGYGVVTLVARDFNRHVLAVGGEIRTIGDTRPLSTVHVQFMVETVKIDNGPSFLPPTRESQHVFVVYTGSVLEIPLYATDGTQIKFLTRSIPNRQFNVHATQTVTHDGKKMSSTIVTWEPTREDAGVYLFSASVIDSTGRDGIDRNYKIIVKDAVRESQPKSGPFRLIETVEGPVQCLQHATCTFFVSVATESNGGPVVNLTESRVSTANVQIGAPQKMNDSYTSYISITSSTIGTSDLCLKAIDPHGSRSEDICLPILINPRDPCEFPSCVHGVCKSDKDQYLCSCEEGYTGPFCESVIPTRTTTVTTTTTKSTIISTTITTTPTTTITIQSSAKKTTAITTKPITTTTTSPTTTTITQTASTTKPTITATKRTSTPHITSTPRDPFVHLSSPSTSGLPSCSEVVNSHPSRQCLCLFDNKPIHCPSPATTTATTVTATTNKSTTISITLKTTPTTKITTPSSTTNKTNSTTTQDTTILTTTSSPTTTTIMQTATATSLTDRTSTPHTTSTSTQKYPLVHLSPPSTSGFPSCREVVSSHPSRQCMCLSDNQLIQCPFQKFGTLNSNKHEHTRSMSVLIPLLGCMAGLTAGVIAILFIKRFCCPCSKKKRVSADSLESLKQEDEERYVESKPRRHYQRNNPRAQRKIHPHRL